jgi:hypothetical protein
MMRYVIALNGSFFTAQRMLQEYMIRAYDFDHAAGDAYAANGGARVGALAASI